MGCKKVGAFVVTTGDANLSLTTLEPGAIERKVLGPLTRLRARLRLYALTVGIASLLVYLLCASIVQFALDYSFRLPLDMRAALLAVVVGGAGWLIYRRIIKPLRVSFGHNEVAAIVERRDPGLRSLLVSAVQFAQGQVGAEASNSRTFVERVIAEACARADRIRFTEALDHGLARSRMFVIVVVFAVWVGAFGLSPEEMGIWFDRNVLLGHAEWKQRTHLIVELPHGVLTGARGDDIEIRARAEGDVPRAVTVEFELATGRSGRETMIAVGERGFRHTFLRADDDFRFRLSGGDDQTEWFTAQLADRPVVEDITLNVTPPEYSGALPFTAPQGQLAIEVLRGSTVRVDARFNKPVIVATLMSGQQPVAPAAGVDNEWSVSIAPEQTKNYHFALVDELDLSNKRPVHVSVRVVEDAAPRVRMKINGVSDIITAQALLPIEMSFSDSFGLADTELTYQIAREGYELEKIQLDDFVPGITNFDTKLLWGASSLPLVPGDHLTLFARATDFNDITGPGESKSGAVTLRIVTREEMLAELARREQEYRQEFERIIEQQEDLRRNLLTLIREMETVRAEDRLTARVAPLERRQRQIGGQVNLLRQQFEQIVAEFRVNGMDTSNIQDRLEDGVVKPMSTLARRSLVSAADRLRAIDRSDAADSAELADAGQQIVLDDMRRILANMLKWEGFQEAVTMLRDVLRLQQELHGETQDEIERRAADILGGG